jgi:hypothetical protein
LQIEDVELLLLRRYQAAHKAGEENKLDRLTIALEEVRELIEAEKKRRR